MNADKRRWKQAFCLSAFIGVHRRQIYFWLLLEQRASKRLAEFCKFLFSPPPAAQAEAG